MNESRLMRLIPRQSRKRKSGVQPTSPTRCAPYPLAFQPSIIINVFVRAPSVKSSDGQRLQVTLKVFDVRGRHVPSQNVSDGKRDRVGGKTPSQSLHGFFSTSPYFSPFPAGRAV